MGAKKIIIPIVIAAAVAACGVGYYCYNTVKAGTLSKSTATSSSSANTNVSNASTNTTSGVNGTTGTENSSNTNKTSSTTIDNNSKVITSNSGNSTSNDSKNITSTGTTTKSTSSTTNSGTITYTVPSGQYSESAVLVENTTGKAMSQEQLDKYLRSWIMVGQNGCESICDATGTYWEEPWLNKVSQETLYQAFVDANGEGALSQNITANEFIKATQELDNLTADDVPFTLSQAKTLILEMLQEDGYATPSEVTKIIFVQETSGPSVYEVYTKESGNNVFWIVYANNGYAHG